MRILHVSAYYAPAFVYGGPPRSIHALCRAQRARGVDVQVFTTDANGASALPPADAARREFEGVPVRYWPRSWPPSPIGSRALTAALRAALPRTDVVHVHGLWNRVVWAAVRESSRAGVPYVLSPRGMLEPGALVHRAWRKRLAFAAVERRTLASAALLHATSAVEAETLRAWAPGADLVLIPNGVELPDDVAAAGREPLLLFVGRLHPVKRLDLLLDAFVRVHAVRPDARLAIAGPDECGLRATLAARHPSLAPAVDWLGEVTAPARDRLLARARALVLCSAAESFGLAVVEAMASACPVVVTRTCGWDEAARAGAGLLVDSRADDIAGALLTLLGDAPLAEAMGRRGRALAAARYAWPPIADAFIERYAALARRGAPRAGRGVARAFAKAPLT